MKNVTKRNLNTRTNRKPKRIEPDRIINVLFAVLLLPGVLLLANCKGKQTPPGGDNHHTHLNPDKNGTESKAEPLAAEFRKEGMLSQNQYQVFITAFGETPAEARENGLQEARLKALNLMSKDPVLNGRRLSSRNMKDLKRFIQQYGKVIKVHKEPSGSWSVVLRIEKSGLRNYLMRLQ